MNAAFSIKVDALHRWGKPDAILVATTLKDIPHLVPHAIAQAKLSAAKVLLAHVIEPSYLRTHPAAGAPFVIPEPAIREVQDELGRIVKQFQWKGVLCEPVVLKGLAEEQIPALVKQRNIDRVIVGTRSAGFVERTLLGSVADDLLHELDVPVCVIGPHVRPQVQMDREPGSILFATSLHHTGEQAAQFAIDLANLYQSRLTLLHVMRTTGASENERRRLRHQKEDELSSLITEEARLWASPSIAIREGDPAGEILAESAEMSAELIVLGATGASKASRLLATGVAYRVIAEAKVPVITLRHAHPV